MTDRLYYDDAYLLHFTGRVVSVRADGWIALDRSAFYPTSGGQPYDTGVLLWDGGESRVTDVEVENGVVWHRVSAPIPEGAAVRGEIDWARRLDHMQQHAADHLLAGAAWQTLGGVTIGLHIGKEESSIDMDLPDGRTRLAQEEAEALEDLVNQRVQQDDPIRCWFPKAEELSRLPLRKKPTVTEHVRIVAMGDYEMVACGGTHPATTGQIGPVRILSTAPARGKMRLTFLAGMRAVRDYCRCAQCAEAVSAALSTRVEEAPAVLLREREQQAAERRALQERLTAAALAWIQKSRVGEDAVFACHVPFADPDTLLRAGAELTRDPAAVALLSCPGKKGRSLLFIRGQGAGADMAALLRQSGARGGGKPDLAQGSGPDDDQAIQEALRALLG